MSSSSRLPKYCRNRQKGRSDRADVKIGGKRIELGVYGSPKKKARYAELVGKPQPKPGRPTPNSLTEAGT